MKRKYLLAGSAIVSVLVSVLFYVQSSQTLDLVILHTNDHHGYCWSVEGKGGLAKQMTVIEALRKKNKNALLLSAGDINTGAAESDFNQGEPSFKGMNLLHFDAMAVGNHEFDNGLPLLKTQEQWAEFPFLSANIYDTKNGQRIFKPYLIKNIGGVRVGILGLTTEETAWVALAKFVKDIEFRDPVLEAKKLIPELKANSDVIIAVTHMGYYPEGPDPSHGKGDIVLASENPEILLIVGGHSHTLLPQPVSVGETLIVQVGDNAKYLGEMHLKLNKKNFALKKFQYRVHELNDQVSENPTMVSLLDPYLAKAKSYFEEKMGETLVDLVGERDVVRSQESNLGNVITDAFRDATHAEIGMENAGGIRASIKKGVITYGDIRKAFPFVNQVVTLKLTGKEIQELLDRSASLPRPAGAFLHVSGLSFVIENNKAVQVKVHGKPLQLQKLYSVAMHDFLANGGDGYATLKHKPYKNTGLMVADVLKSYVLNKKRLNAKVEGRIKFSN